MSKRKEESSASSGERKRLRRSCQKKNEDKVKELNDYYSSLFYDIVTNYCTFMFNLLDKINEDPTNLSFQRKYDEMIAELYSFCYRWRDMIELESIYFNLDRQPDLKTSTVYFNYDDPKKFVDQQSMHKLNDENNALEFGFIGHLILDDSEDTEGRVLNAVCKPKKENQSLGTNEDFCYAVETNNIENRLDAFLEDQTDWEQVRSLPTVKFSKKEKETKCSVCMGDFRANEEVFKLQCGHIYHKKCLKEWLKKSMYCPLCKEILS